MILACLAGCTKSQSASPPAQRSFYYWRTTLQLSAAERRALDTLRIQRLYLRFFDVEWSPEAHAPQPVSPLQLAPGERLPARLEVVPVVFVRDEVWSRIGKAGTRALAAHVDHEIAHHAAALGCDVKEIQLDSDWTHGTAETYFAFLKELREKTRPRSQSLSATIRLHQVKYRERTGVPPVDRGMLMFYNMGQIGTDAEPSIFDARSAARYLERVTEYPLHLDVALPIWSWTVQLRDGEVAGLLQNTDPAELAQKPFLRPVEEGLFEATDNTFLNGRLLRQGDRLKAEISSPALALAAANMIAPRLGKLPPNSPRFVSLFDLSERNLARHDPESLERLYRVIH